MQVGEVVGSYRVLGRLGEGGVGTVYRAQHTLSGREATLKVLPSQLRADAAAVARLSEDARASSDIRHPGIVEVFDTGLTSDGRVYLITERLEGESLAARLQRSRRLPVHDALRLARQIGGALAAAHKVGVVHRDLTPGSLFIVADSQVVGGERVKVLDFGVARLQLGSVYAVETADVERMAAPRYTAPEICTGVRGIDGRADLYALGCILFEMLCGQPPIGGEGYAEVLANQIRQTPPSPRSLAPDLSPELEATILRLLAKPREQRFADAGAFLDAISPAQGSMPTRWPSERSAFDTGSALPTPASPFETLTDQPMPPGGFNPNLSGVESSASRTLALGEGRAAPAPSRRRDTASGSIPIETAGAGKSGPPPVPPPGRPGPRRSAPPPVVPTSAVEPQQPLYEVRRRAGGERVVVTAEGERLPEPVRRAPPLRPPGGGLAQAAPDEPTLMSERPMHIASAPPPRAPTIAAPTIAAPVASAQATRPVVPLDAAEPRRWLGVTLVTLAVVAGGIAAYVIATSEELGDEPPVVASPRPSSPRTPSPPPSPPPVPSPSVIPLALDAGIAAVTASPLDAAPQADPPPPVPADGTNRRPAALVTLRLDSLPHGAQVIRKADGVRLGETPFVYEVEPTGGSIELVLRHAGYADESVALPANRSAERTISLTRSTGKDRAPSLKD